MKKNNKKGFTIVELVIVIAVIAILAAVLIPTFSSIITKAKQSADIQAVQQMNTLLSTYVDGSITNVSDAVKTLDNENIDLENYKALQKNHYFYFVMNGKTPMIIYADADNNIIYPKVTLAAGTQWMSLSGQIPTDDNYTIAAGGEVTIDSGAKLAHLIESKKDTNEELTITLAGDIDLKGAAVDFGTPTANITIKSDPANPSTLKGIRADKYSVMPTSGEFANHPYGFGLFGKVASGQYVTIQDVTISGLAVGGVGSTHLSGANTTGLVAGYIYGTVALKNVTFKDCVVNGYQKVGGIVGQLHGTLNMENVKFENVTVNGYCEVAKIAGIVENNGNFSYDANCNFDGITVNGLHDNTEGCIYVNMSQITGGDLVGDSNNTFMAYPDISWVWGLATNDLAWYRYSPDGNSVKSVTINGASYTLNKYTYSTSSKIANGVPTN